MRVVLFGGSFNPPTLADRDAIRLLKQMFDRVIVVPCGIRPDKWETNLVPAFHRARLIELEFGDLGVEIDLSDLERDEFTTTLELDRVWREHLRDSSAEVWHAIWCCHTRGGANSQSSIQRDWADGHQVWDTLNIAVITADGIPCQDEDLPTHSLRLPPVPFRDGHEQLREKLVRGQDLTGLVSPRGVAYAKRFGLFRGTPGSHREGRLVLPTNPAFYIAADEHNPKARAWAEQFPGAVDNIAEADAVIAIGGDGHMLDAIYRNQPLVPVIGINAGHLGFLLNDVEPQRLLEHIAEQGVLHSHLLPMLEVRVQNMDGSWQEATHRGFQDVWLDRLDGQAIWVNVDVKGRDVAEMIDRMVCDLVLVCTAAGTSAYARLMGAPILPFTTPALTLAGQGVGAPNPWHSVLLPDDVTVTFTSIGGAKRPARAYIDGRALGQVQSVSVRQSRVLSTELAFLPWYSLTAKIMKLQFPRKSS